jgi:hypothetical protein
MGVIFWEILQEEQETIKLEIRSVEKELEFKIC